MSTTFENVMAALMGEPSGTLNRIEWLHTWGDPEKAADVTTRHATIDLGIQRKVRVNNKAEVNVAEQKGVLRLTVGGKSTATTFHASTAAEIAAALDRIASTLRDDA